MIHDITRYNFFDQTIIGNILLYQSIQLVILKFMMTLSLRITYTIINENNYDTHIIIYAEFSW